MQIIVAGIPLLIAVPEPALEIWREQCGGMGAILQFSQDDMRHWWLGLGKD